MNFSELIMKSDFLYWLFPILCSFGTCLYLFFSWARTEKKKYFIGACPLQYLL